jgi:hypothetical protein
MSTARLLTSTLVAALGALLWGCHAPVWSSAEILSYEIPPHTRSFTVVLTGAPDALYALASFKIRGQELVGIPRDELVVDMRDSYFDAGSAVPKGGLLQQTRLGTYTFVYPYAPGQPHLDGTVELEIATTSPQAPVGVHALMPRHDGSRVLHVGRAEVLKAQGQLAEALRAYDQIFGEVPKRIAFWSASAEWDHLGLCAGACYLVRNLIGAFRVHRGART